MAERSVKRLDAALRAGPLRPSQDDIHILALFVDEHNGPFNARLAERLVAEKAALSYAVSEWARIWPLQTLIRAMGAYFVRRNSKDPLYRKVLERYVAMATQAGVTQAVFLEGGPLARRAAARPQARHPRLHGPLVPIRGACATPCSCPSASTTTELELKGEVLDRMRELEARGAHVYVPRGDQDYAITVGLRMLTLRRLVTEADGLYAADVRELPLLAYYASSIAHLFGRLAQT